MLPTDALKVMLNERKCILRAKERNCNQSHCFDCDLCMPDNVILNAYDTVIEMLSGFDDDLK